MKQAILFLSFLFSFTLQVFAQKAIVKNTKPASSSKTISTKKITPVVAKKVEEFPVVKKTILPSINLDKYLAYPSEEIAIHEIDSLYPNTIITQIENCENVLYSRKFDLVYHLIDKFETTPTIDYLYNLNKFDFVCGVGLKRTKVVSPACVQPKIYATNIESEKKVKLATLILTKGIKTDLLAVNRCVAKNELELFEVLYANLKQNDASPSNGEKLLVEASDQGCYDIVKFLLENNVSPNGADQSFYAIYRSVKYSEIFFLLTEKGADVNIKGYAGTTPIIHAAREGCIEVLQYLLDKGISPYEKQGTLTAYEMAKKYNEKNRKEVIALLKKYELK
jgi:Ankyrin repeats (3 copies)